MTVSAWERESRRLQSAITRYDTKARKAMTLAERLQHQAAKKAHQEMLRQHRLNYHDLTQS